MMTWEQLYQTCATCEKCLLSDTRTNIVFGAGNPKASVLFVGEAPGEKEDLSGEPFVGRGGKLLDEFLQVVDLSRKENIYIANMVKCRPPKNRDPLVTERNCCLDYLRHQVALMRPKIIVCLGRIAATSLIRADFKITQEHGICYEKNGVVMMGLYHPAAILRDPRRRVDMLEDMKKLQAKIQEICPETYG